MSENRPVDSPSLGEGLIVPSRKDMLHFSYDTAEDEMQCDKTIQVNIRIESLSLL